MDGPTRHGKAKSCTTCRQVKLKCDLRTTHPQPCSRCTANSLTCKTDAAFTRVSARHRIKDLQQQVKRLEQKKSPLRPATLPPGQTAARIRLTPDIKLSSESWVGAASYDVHASAPWLCLTNEQQTFDFELLAVRFTYADARELFEHFARLYQPHFAILESCSSLHGLAGDCPLLFWTILLVASRFHAVFHTRHTELQKAHVALYGTVCQESVRSLPDLQAILLLCTWPTAVFNQSRDPSWQQLGMAINAARQMGLHKISAQPSIGTTADSKGSRHAARLTWLKCFELEVQMSIWQGHTPVMAITQYIQSISTALSNPEIPSKYNAVIELHLQAAYFLDLINNGHEIHATSAILRAASNSIDDSKLRHFAHWDDDTELVYLAVKQCLWTAPLTGMRESPVSHSTLGNDQAQPFDTLGTPLILESLEASRQIAESRVTLLHALATKAHEADFGHGHQPRTRFMPGYPKSALQQAYYAGVVLLKYLDMTRTSNSPEACSAQQAFATIHCLFAECTNSPELVKAATTLEIARRAINRAEHHDNDFVTLGTPDWKMMFAHIDVRPTSLQTSDAHPGKPLSREDAIWDESSSHHQLYTLVRSGSTSTAMPVTQELHRSDIFKEGICAANMGLSVEVPFGTWNDDL